MLAFLLFDKSRGHKKAPERDSILFRGRAKIDREINPDRAHCFDGAGGQPLSITV